jgi:hypothetical protein
LLFAIILIVLNCSYKVKLIIPNVATNINPIPPTKQRTKEKETPPHQPTAQGLQEPSNQAQPHHQSHNYKGTGASARNQKKGVPTARKPQPPKKKFTFLY